MFDHVYPLLDLFFSNSSVLYELLSTLVVFLRNVWQKEDLPTMIYGGLFRLEWVGLAGITDLEIWWGAESHLRSLGKDYVIIYIF